MHFVGEDPAAVAESVFGLSPAELSPVAAFEALDDLFESVVFPLLHAAAAAEPDSESGDVSAPLPLPLELDLSPGKRKDSAGKI
jgi:hypothetical protein